MSHDLEHPIVEDAVYNDDRDNNRVDHDAVLIGLLPRAITRIEPKHFSDEIGNESILRHLHAGEKESTGGEDQEPRLHEKIEERVLLFVHGKMVAHSMSDADVTISKPLRTESPEYLVVVR